MTTKLIRKIDEKHGKSSEEDKTFMHARCIIVLSLNIKRLTQWSTVWQATRKSNKQIAINSEPQIQTFAN